MIDSCISIGESENIADLTPIFPNILIISQIKKFNSLSAHFWMLLSCYEFNRYETYIWSDSYFRSKNIFYLFDERFIVVFTSYLNLNLVCTKCIGKYFYKIIFNFRDIIQYIK